MFDARKSYEEPLSNIDSLVASTRGEVVKRAQAIGLKTAEDLGDAVNSVIAEGTRTAAALRAAIEKRAQLRREKVAIALHIMKTALRLGSC